MANKEIGALTKLNKLLKESKKAMNEAKNLDDKVKHAEKGYNEYNRVMENIGQSQDPEYKKLKTENRALYDELNKIREQKNAEQIALKNKQLEAQKEKDKQDAAQREKDKQETAKKEKEKQDAAKEKDKQEAAKKEEKEKQDAAQKEKQLVSVSLKLSNILGDLSNDIKLIKNPEAKKVADKLFTNLDTACNNFIVALKQNSPNSDVDFMDACKTALEEAKPTLEEDIGWGEYLENLWNRLIDFCKSVMGMKTGFFENKSEYSKSISDKVDRLKASKL